MATELENLVPEADVEVEGMRGPKGEKGDSYVLTEADKEEIARKVDTIIDAETDKSLTISGKPADAKAAGDEINNLKADLNDIRDSVDDIEADTATKVKKPLTSPDGTNGQILRSLGNGNTEWSDIGAPTDEQVQTFIDAWLNEHPEATTTVEDWSLSSDKLIKGTLGYVTPDMFGAKGDGVTDDTVAVRAAVNYAIQNNLYVFIPQKTYVITHASNTINLFDNQSAIIMGAGQKSVIKRKDDSLVNKWNRLFVFAVGACTSEPANDVILSNFCIDSNRRNQSNATDDYTYEAAADVVVMNGTGLSDPSYQYIDRVILRDMRFYDPVADCFNFSGSNVNYVKNVWIDGMKATDRKGTRNDIGFTATPLGDVWIKNCNVESIHFEYNNPIGEDDIVTFHFDSVTTGSFSIGGRIDAVLTNVHSKQLLLSDYRHIVITGSIFDLRHTNHYIYNKNNPNNQLDIIGCLFINHYNDEGLSTALYFRELTNVAIIGCRFEVIGDNDLDLDDDGTYDHVAYSAFRIESFARTTIIIDSCVFSQKFRNMCSIVSGCSMTLKNLFIDTGIALNFGALSSTGQYTDISVRLLNVELGEKCTKSFVVNAFNGPPAFRFDGDMICKENNFLCSFDTSVATSNFYSALTGTFKRKLKLSAPLDFPQLKSIFKYTDTAKHNYIFFKGDEFEYTSETTPYKWVAKSTATTTTNTIDGVTGSQIPLSQRFKTYGSACGDTSSRPTCILDKGFVYFDTDLGKPIYWNGTGWVDSSGVAVA